MKLYIKVEKSDMFSCFTYNNLNWLHSELAVSGSWNLKRMNFTLSQFHPERIRTRWFCGQAEWVCDEFGNVWDALSLLWQKDNVPLGSGVTEWWSLHLSVISSELASTRRWLPHFFPWTQTAWAGQPDAAPPPSLLPSFHPALWVDCSHFHRMGLLD